MIVGIINTRICNGHSIMSAIERLGYNASFVSTADEVQRCTHAIIPGVGNFKQGVSYLEKEGLAEAIHDHKDQGKPFVGDLFGYAVAF